MWDYIVVGGGSAGCVVAARLSEDPRCRVLLLEAGLGFLDQTPLIGAPAGAFYVCNNRWFDWRYQTQPDSSCAGRMENVYGGKLLGGGSSINGTVFIRGSAEDFDEWAKLGNKGWAYDDVLPFFKRMEATSVGDSYYHGRNGPVGVDYAAPMLDISHRFIEAASEVGILYNSDINGARLEGVSRTPCSVLNGVRQSTARAYLRPAMSRQNLKVVTRALVRRVIFEGRDAVAVEYTRSGTTYFAKAAREIVLSAGGIRSPHILLLSGIGPARQLRDIGIPVVSELTGVGQNYMDHAACHMLYNVKLPTWCRDLLLGRQAWQALRWLLLKTGPAQSGVSQAIAFVRTQDNCTRPDLQISLLPVFVDQSKIKRVDPEFSPKDGCDRIMVYIDECKPAGRGHLRLASANAEDAPLVYPNMLGGERSIQTLIRGVHIVRKILAAGAIKPYITREVSPGSDACADASIEQWIRSAALSMAHPSGTCKMGQDELSVVDEKLRVRGVGRLRVADASIMPTIPSGNINAPTIMIGERAAALIRGELDGCESSPRSSSMQRTAVPVEEAT
jgi:choline dehydrogenase